MAEPFDYTREGALIPSSTDTTGLLGQELPRAVDLLNIRGMSSYVPPERSDLGIAFEKGKRLLSGSGEVLLKGFTGDFIKSLGFEEAGDTWLSDAYQSGLLMGIDVNELDDQLKGPKTLEEIEDWKGAIAWGMNAVAEQIPNLVTTFAPAVIGTLILKRPVLGSVTTLGTIDFLNTAEVYTDLLMQTGESRPAVAASTGAMMSVFDMIVPNKIIGRIGKGPDYARWFSDQLANPKSGVAKSLGVAILTGAQEGSTEYVQTMLEGMALNYVEEKDLIDEFSKAQREEQLEAGARGAVVGTLLGIPVAYTGFSARQAAKKYKQSALDRLSQDLSTQNELDSQSLPADLQGFSLIGAPEVTSPTMADLSAQRAAGIAEESFRNRSSISATQYESIFDGPISKAEFDEFVRNGFVSPSRLRKIAKKYIDGEELSIEEKAIFGYTPITAEINQIISDIKAEQDRSQRIKKANALAKLPVFRSILRGTTSIPEAGRLRELPPFRGAPEQVAQPSIEVTEPIPDVAGILGERYLARQREVQEREQKRTLRSTRPQGVEARPVKRQLKRVGFTDVPGMTGAEVTTNYGFQVNPVTDVLTKTGKSAISRGKSEKRNEYENAQYVIKKASSEGTEKTTLESKTTTKDAPWVVIDKDTGLIVGEAKNQELQSLLEEYSISSGELQQLAEEQRRSQEEVEANIVTRELSKAGAIPINTGDIVRPYSKRDGEYLTDQDFIVQKIQKISRNLPKSLQTKDVKKEDGFAYSLEPVSGGNVQRAEVYPSGPNSLVVTRSVAAVQDVSPEVVTTEQEFVREELLTPEERSDFAEEAGLTRKEAGLTTQEIEDVRSKKTRFDVPYTATEKGTIVGTGAPKEKVGPIGTSILRLDPNTGEKPSPETHRVKLSKEGAQKHGLDPSVYYDWEEFSFPQWGEQKDDFIKVAGQLVRHKSRRVREGGKTVTLDSELSSLRKRPSDTKLKREDFEEVKDFNNLPDEVPNKSTIDQAYIDYRTGVFIVRRKTTGEESPKFDYSDVEVYLTYNNKKEHQAKVSSLGELFDDYSVDQIDAGKTDETGGKVTIPVLVRKRTDKTIRKVGVKRQAKTTGEERTVSIKADEPSVRSALEDPGSKIKVKLKPMVVAKINRERKKFKFKPVQPDSLFDVSESSLTDSEGLISVSSDGFTTRVGFDSLSEAQVTRFEPDKEGAIRYYEMSLDRSPDIQGARLIASFKVDKASKNIPYSKFIEEMFSDTAHRYGMFGTNKESVRSAREKVFEENKGKSAVLNLYSGVQVFGTITGVESGSLKVYVTTAKGTPSRKLKPTLVDLLSIESFQIKKPKGYVAEQAQIEDVKPEGELFIYVPINDDITKQNQPAIPTTKPVVKVYKNPDNTYAIVVDDVTEFGAVALTYKDQKRNLTLDETVDYLNKLEKETGSEMTVQNLPQGIIVEPVSYLSRLVGKKGKYSASKGRYEFETAPPKVRYVYKKANTLTNPLSGGRIRNLRKEVSEENKRTTAELKEQLEKDSDKASTEISNAIDEIREQQEVARIEANAKRNSQVASNTERTFEEVKDTPFINLPPNQKFRDKNGGLWRVMDTVGMKNTSVQFLGGPAPDINFQVTWEGQKAEGKFEKNFIVTVRGSSTPSTMEIKADNKRFYNYSIVTPVPADGNGSIKYNTGLTPKRFRELLGSNIGRLNINRLIEKGFIKVVQSQQDMKNPPLDLAVKAVTRNGEVVFITNNVREEEVVSVFVHEIGVHVGLKEVYGAEFGSLIEEVKSRKGTEGWESAFENAEIVADKFYFADDIARDNFIAEEALAYYVESNNNFKDSLWQRFLDAISRWVAKTKIWFGGKLTDDQLIAFARGAVRGMSERNFENAINAIDEEYYSQNADAFDKVAEAFEKSGVPFDSATRREYVGKARGLWDATKKFFDPFAKLPFGRLFRKFRSELQGRLGEIEQYANDVAAAYEGLNEQENQELFDFFTNKDASPDMISRQDLRAASVNLKNKIMEIADEGLLRGMYPEASQEQMEELRGAYLPRVFLYHILRTGGTRGSGQKKASKREYAVPRMEDMDQDMRDLWGEIKDVRYLLYRAVTMPQQDIAIIDFAQTISEAKAFKETPEAERINAEINKLRIARQDENATEEQRAELLSQIGDLRKELKNLQKEGKRFVAGQVPWVMPNQWVKVTMKTPKGDKTTYTTLASVSKQIETYKQYKDNAPNLSDKAREGIIEQIASLEEARKEFLDSVGVDEKLDPESTRDAETIQNQIDTYYDDNFDMSLFQKMPNDINRYGSIANLYVRKEIYEDIMGNSDMVTGEQNLFQRMLLPYGKHAKLVSIFKTMKVPLNPPTVVRNFVANLIMMQLFGGVAFRRQPALLMEALREMRGGERGAVFTHSKDGTEFTAFELAMKQGIGATTLTNAELRKMEKIFSFMEKDGVWGLVTKGQSLWNQIAEFGSNLYQGIETLGKVAVINDMLQNQRAELEKILAESDAAGVLTIEDIAVQEANRVLFDYSEVHPTVRGLRSSFLGAPFITYQVKVLPQLAKVLSDPSKYHRFLPYVMMIGSMQALFGSIPFMDDDWDKMKELLPEWTRDNTMAFLPWKDSNGNWQAVDVSYFFPWTWFTQTGSNLMKGEFAKAAVEGGIVGPAWQLMTTFLTGKDPWSGYQIVNQNDATSDKIFDYMSYANSMIMPPWLTRNGIVSVSSLAEAMGRLDPTELEGKLPDLLLGRTNRYGEPRRSAMGVIGSAVGLTTYAVSPQARTIENKRYASEIRGLESDITFAQKNRRLSPTERTRKVNALRERIDEVRKERAEYNKKTSGIERAL